MHVLPDSTLPSVASCLQRSKALAMLDAVLSPEWEYRFFSFDRRWEPGQQMASMRHGSGDHYFMLFVQDGCILKTFEHEQRQVRDTPSFLAALADLVPDLYQGSLTEAAFMWDDVSSVA